MRIPWQQATSCTKIALRPGTMDSEGHRFPAIEFDGELVPEAGVLPHLHMDIVERYPRAIVKHDSIDRDLPSNEVFDNRGRKTGLSCGLSECGRLTSRSHPNPTQSVELTTDSRR